MIAHSVRLTAHTLELHEEHTNSRTTAPTTFLLYLFCGMNPVARRNYHEFISLRVNLIFCFEKCADICNKSRCLFISDKIYFEIVLLSCQRFQLLAENLKQTKSVSINRAKYAPAILSGF